MSERFLLSHLGFEGHGVGGAVFPGPIFGWPQSPVDVMQKLSYFEHLSDEHLEEVTSRVLSSGAYINLEDPSVVICRVPEGWPPKDVHVKKKSLCHSAIGTIASKINVTPKGVYLPISKLRSILAVANLLAHNNKSQIFYYSHISLQSAADNCSFLTIWQLLG